VTRIRHKAQHVNSKHMRCQCIVSERSCGPLPRACCSVQWCTKWAVMTWNVQWWKAVCAVMIYCPIAEIKHMCKCLKKSFNFFGKKVIQKSRARNVQWWFFLKICSAFAIVSLVCISWSTDHSLKNWLRKLKAITQLYVFSGFGFSLRHLIINYTPF